EGLFVRWRQWLSCCAGQPDTLRILSLVTPEDLLLSPVLHQRTNDPNVPICRRLWPSWLMPNRILRKEHQHEKEKGEDAERDDGHKDPCKACDCEAVGPRHGTFQDEQDPTSPAASVLEQDDRVWTGTAGCR